MTEPAFWAVAATTGLVTSIVLLRSRGRRGSPWERRGMTLFLGLMPTVYLASGLRHGASLRWLGVELLGQAVFATLAFVATRRSAVVLALGFAGHGLAWDSWHIGQSTFIGNWYVLACLVVDLSFGFYLWTQARAFEARSDR